MKLNRLFAAAFVAILLGASHAGANAAEPEEHFQLTPALLAKLKAAAPDIKKLEKKDEDAKDGKDKLSAEDFARVLDKEPRAKAVLAKHGLGTREFALSTYAMLHAGMFVGLEPSMNKKQAADMLASFTKEQRANVALLRKTDMSAFK
ncbi:hypothetical protein [Massilia sp. 9I]|uniref:hypothetical protein n=1 Tax=Massilia sp. 9I TaxID=2653152 RepID=UPI0012F358E9|nr:hypothetical protein [Massilia sp. 9I]VXC66354.1 conserved exported hypothetical protein [Massilia sp. 9I]